jgi:uncharacterized membrane protein YbhN (UPF0104 family)
MSRLRAICRGTGTGAIRWTRLGAVAAIAATFLAVPALAHVPARLLTACAKWIALAAIFELVSMLGFVLVFALVFGARLSIRQRLGTGLRALGAITVLPAGGLVGPAMAARTAGDEAAPLSVVTRSTIALTILTSAPILLVLGALGFTLWLVGAPGPHTALLTLPAAGVAVAVVGGVWLIGRSSQPLGASRRGSSRSTRGHRLVAGAEHCRAGAMEARRLVVDGNWKLGGAIAYYAFDNAVLWAAFHAYGRAPAISVIVMGYLVGSLGALLPLPAGIGGVEGGLIGALVLYGASAAPAASAVLLYRGISLSLPVALGGLAWGIIPARLLRSGRGTVDRSTRPPCPAAAAAAHAPSD